ncbi:MAG TPA: sugar phosphate nucleotidyltransferase [Pseudomonadota bacterium]|nr:sugar phosphate nucleotidyltransferase [Pseudomonadota bacterium]
MKLLVLAAGYATRLRPLTDHQAKPLLPVRGRPMIDHVLDKFHGCAAIDGVYVVTNSRYAGNFSAWAQTVPTQHPGCGWQVRVFDDGTHSNEDRRGAIGDIHFVIEQAGLDDDLIVVAGDNLFSQSLVDYVATAQRQGILIGVYDVGNLELIKQYNNIRVEPETAAGSSAERITYFEEKPAQPVSTLTAIALYHYPRASLPLIRQYIAEGQNPDQPGRLVQWLYPRAPCYAYRIAGLWLDIGSKESYEEAQRLL